MFEFVVMVLSYKALIVDIFEREVFDVLLKPLWFVYVVKCFNACLLAWCIDVLCAAVCCGV